MITLGVETSGHRGSIALCRDATLLGERDLTREGQRHARTLVPELQALLHAHALSPRDVQTLAVSIGPGSFTGLRVGVVCAKTWAYATGARVVAVDTMQAVASQSDETVHRLQVVSDAQRGELFVGLYERASSGEWLRQGEIEIVPVEQWLASLGPADVVSGPGLIRLIERVSSRCRVEPATNWNPAARTIARLGGQAARAGMSDDFWALEPRYLRRSAAEEKADAR